MALYNGNLKLIACVASTRLFQTQSHLRAYNSRVTGPTGAGKTTFINYVCGSNLEVGTGLRSCTKDIGVAYCMMGDAKVVLIDTPGFDDTTKSQADVLEDIGRFLKQTYEKDIKLTGVIYMHRISDRRVGGIARKNFRLFGKICGPEAMKNVFIVTTMWEDVSEEVGQAREQELVSKPIFFQPAVAEGAKLVRHQKTAESAQSIVCSLINNAARGLQMQRELVEERRQVPETAAGCDLLAILVEQEERHQREMLNLREEIKSAGKMEIVRLKEELKKVKEELRRVKGEEDKLRGGNGLFRFLRVGWRIEYRVLLCWKVHHILESQ
ncbi:P-loop containing nucleoside triphosphate hydrolase protein [Fomitopsis serialis]|uniref:P-loop containing nucleoside triphosphate hydrolase protein n=1 Tax=Fomitopsis serialis TaxID=139415 RepID=UPI002008D927|nr:P-loop containing nucleoside triphosphate hydrolase protein [Neoantrodia serialis]KAH9925223.1 P-loop containing nucleoside triphosphate hydrolase protein [Neoantrodia serialis]